MSEKILNSRVVHKHDIEANWIKAANFVPKQAEIIIYDKDASHDYQRLKIGDVSTATGTAADVLAGKIVFGKSASGNAVKLTGTMANNGAISATIDGLTTTSYTVPAGFTEGGTVTLTNAIETALAAI